MQKKIEYISECRNRRNFLAHSNKLLDKILDDAYDISPDMAIKIFE